MSDQDARDFFHMVTNPGHGDRYTRKAEELAKKLGKTHKYRFHFTTAIINGFSALNFTVKAGNVFIAKLLLAELAVDPNTTKYDKSSRTTLHYAALAGQLELVTLLMTTYNSDPGACDKCGSTPLHLAIFNDHSATAVKIIELGANVEIQNHFGMAMHAAAFTGCPSVVAAIAERFPEQANLAISGFVTPLVCAIFGYEPECEKILQKLVSLDGKALLYKVVCVKDEESEAYESVRTLLQLGADPNRCEEVLYEDLAIICAAQKSWSTVITLLLEKTKPIDGVNWNEADLIHYVGTEHFRARDAERVTNRVNQLKLKILDELNNGNCLTAFIICMSLKYDMDAVEWDQWSCLCQFLTFALFEAYSITCNAESIYRWVRSYSSTGKKSPNLDWAIIGLKGCLALSPNNPEYMNLYRSLT